MDPQTRQIIADLYEQLRAYAVDIHGTENLQVWHALRNARRQLDAQGADTVIMTTREYSVTTAKHKCMIRRAVPAHVPVVYARHGMPHHQENAAEYLLEIIAREEALTNARKGRSQEIKQALLDAEIERARAYFTAFGLTDKLTQLQAHTLDLEAVKARVQQRREQAQAAQEQAEIEHRAAAQRLAEITEQLNAWRNGGPMPASARYLPPALRISGTNVETSHGAAVSIAVALKALRRLERGALATGEKVGLHEVQLVTADVLTIGCHRIPRAEIERIKPALLEIEHQADPLTKFFAC